MDSKELIFLESLSQIISGIKHSILEKEHHSSSQTGGDGWGNHETRSLPDKSWNTISTYEWLNKSKTEKQYEHSGVAKSESVHKSERDAVKGP